MKILPGLDTIEDRKKFAVFHAYMLVISIIAGFLFTGIKNQFVNLKEWIIITFFIWNIIGSIRFHDDAFDNSGAFVARGVYLILFFCFPIFYIYNLFCLLVEYIRKVK